MNFGLSFGELWRKTHLNIVSVEGKSNFKGLFLLHFYAQFIVTTQSTEPSSHNEEDTMHMQKNSGRIIIFILVPVAVTSVFRILFLPAIANCTLSHLNGKRKNGNYFRIKLSFKSYSMENCPFRLTLK
ncbi:hypothetical protein CEXT_28921 [Caerostris extrusa]|uniref:Uncharacterized protein n=1 Tax=Caerostris extrusa TaxID=172846 RepID=A0AAV4Y8X9_CAEEX|nr:hypothetical protein CEXT_28921 [Caerostris extrusa]